MSHRCSTDFNRVHIDVKLCVCCFKYILMDYIHTCREIEIATLVL